MIKGMKFYIYLVLLMPLVIYGQTGTTESEFIFFSGTNFSGIVGSGARAFGMGGTFIAIADDATAASWNPGGLGQLEKSELSMVLRYQNYRTLQPASIAPGGFIGPQDKDANSYDFDFFSFTYPIRIGTFKIVPQVSYQRSISFDLDTRMNNVLFSTLDTSGNQIDGTFTEMDKFTGGIDMISLSVGSKLFGWLNIGVSTNMLLNKFQGRINRESKGNIYRAATPSLKEDFTEDRSRHITIDIKGVNVNVGVLAEVFENFKIGAVYKNPFSIDLDYSIAYSQETNISGQTTTKIDSRHSGVSPLRWPRTWGVGISYRPSDPLTLSVDFTSTRWSRAILKNFKYLADDQGTDVYFPTLAAVNEQGGEKQVDSQQLRFGFEYVAINKTNLFIPLRLGIFTDTQFFSDSTGKKVTLFGIAGGAGLKKGAFSFDAAILYEFGSYLKENTDYSYTTFADLRIYFSTIFNF